MKEDEAIMVLLKVVDNLLEQLEATRTKVVIQHTPVNMKAVETLIEKGKVSDA